MAKRKVEELDTANKFTLAVNTFVALTNKRVSKLEFESMSDYCDALSDSMFRYQIDKYPKCTKDTIKIAKDYYAFKKKTIDEVTVQKKNFPKNTDAADKWTQVIKEFKACDKIVQDILKFANGKIDVKIKDTKSKKSYAVNLHDLAIEEKDASSLKKLGKGAAGLASILTGSILPALIPEGISKFKKELKQFKENSLGGKLKTGGALALGGLGMLTGTGLGIMGASWLKEKANADAQIKKNHEEFTKSFKEKLIRNKQEFKLGNSMKRSGGSSAPVATPTSSNMIFDILEDLNMRGKDVTKYESVKRKYAHLKAAKGGIFDLKGGSNTRLGQNLNVNEQGAEQAIVLPAKKSPLDTLIQKVTETNQILYEQLDMQEDQARLAALAHKENKKEVAIAAKDGIQAKGKAPESKSIIGELLTAEAIKKGLAMMLASVGGMAGLMKLAGQGALVAGAAYGGWKIGGLINEGINKAVESTSGEKGATLGGKIYDWTHSDKKMAKGGNILVGEAGAESLRVTPKDNKDFPSGSSRNPFYVVEDERKKKRNPDDIKLAALQTKAFSAMQVNKSEDEMPLAATKADMSITDKISSLFGGEASPSTGGKKRGFLKSIFGGKEFDISKLQSGVGAVAAQFESGGRGAGTISSGRGDAGGKSYGTHQLSSARGTLKAFLGSSGYGNQFSGLAEGGVDFDAKWRQLAESDPNFAKAQQDYIAKTHAAPQLEKLEAMGIDIKNRAIQEMAFSTGVQYGPDSNVIKDAIKASGKNPKSMSIVDIINTVQDYKAGNVASNFRSSSSAVQASVANRHGGGERQALLATEMSVAQPRMMAEGSVKNIKSNSRGAGEGSRLKAMEVGVDAQMQASHAQGTQQAINNISIGGSSTPIPPANITTGDNMSFAALLAKSYNR